MHEIDGEKASETQEGHQFPYHTLNPVIDYATVSGVFEITNPGPLRERLSQIHPDLQPVEYTLSAIRKNLTPPIDPALYQQGLEGFLVARDLTLQNPQRLQEPISDAATHYILLLLGGNKTSEYHKQVRNFNEKIIEAYESNLSTLPLIEADEYPLIKSEAASKTRTHLEEFAKTQPYVADYLSAIYPRGKATEEEIVETHSRALGLLDGFRIFKTAQEKNFERDFKRKIDRFRSFYKRTASSGT